ncbi:MAG: 5'/3'-nucleotidase SurE [Gemmatimonadetes bacterium]|nr:5'/3'-nucleotidase SurE [Gemmatimonadota bacterium]MYD27265.1 5'/3'-nucleotidase SurE [Gemmatimonadota bacterium]MYI99043.1 5'/3'-nucleotidase SurE [Gemmatimonadota bacterium]
MKLIVTNDDGIEAPGLLTLEGLASQWGEVVVVAPAEVQSGAAHQLTNNQPIRVDELGGRRYRVWGTPADCARLAVNQLATDGDWLLSGINNGGNLGVDVYESGTVAAAREGAIHGFKAMALSHYTADGRKIDWPLAAERLRPVLERLLREEPETGVFYNVNLPHPDHDKTRLEVKSTPVDTSPFRITFTPTEDGYLHKGNYHERHRKPGSDIDQCFSGHISLSMIRV